MMRVRSVTLFMLILVGLAVGCDDGARDPVAPLAGQSWSQTSGQVEGIPIGEVQVKRAMEDGELSREEAIAELQTRKRILAKAIDDPPPHADVHFRQAMVQTMLLEEADKSESGGQVDAEQVDKVRKELVEKLRQPAGFIATIVRVEPGPDADVTAPKLLETARALADSLDDDPSDDDVAALAERELDDMVVTVTYAVPFPAADESKLRPGWTRVSGIGAGEVQTLDAGDRVTSAYTVNQSVAEFMVKIAEIPAEPPDDDTIDELIDERLKEARRENYTKRLVDRLVEEGGWTLFPETMEGDLEGAK